MKTVILTILMCSVTTFTVSCTNPRPIDVPSSEIQPSDSIAVEYPEGIDPQQTSDDPTYGYSRENPIMLGSQDEFGGPAAERLYLSHLRDSKFRRMRFKRLGSYGGGSDDHIIDGYELTTQDGQSMTIFIDMYHSNVHPFQVKVPRADPAHELNQVNPNTFSALPENHHVSGIPVSAEELVAVAAAADRAPVTAGSSRVFGRRPRTEVLAPLLAGHIQRRRTAAGRTR